MTSLLFVGTFAEKKEKLTILKKDLNRTVASIHFVDFSNVQNDVRSSKTIQSSLFI